MFPFCLIFDVTLSTLLFPFFAAAAAHRTLADNLAELPGLKEGQEIIMPVSDPIKKTGHLQARKTTLFCQLKNGESLAVEPIPDRRRWCPHNVCVVSS